MRYLIPVLLVATLFVGAGVGGTFSAPAAPDGAPAAANSPIVARLDGTVSNVAVVGNRAYVGVGTRILALDVEQPDRAVASGWSGVLPSPVHHLAAANDQLYAANGYVTTFDLTDPSNPRLLGMLSEGACRIVPNGPYLYELGECSGFPVEHVVDVSDPRHPTRLGELPYSQPHNDLAVSGEVGFATYNVFLHILDMRDPAAPVKVGELDAGGGYRLAYDPPVLYATTSQGMMTYDVGRFPIPVARASFDAGTRGIALAVADEIAFLVTASGLTILDVSQPDTIAVRSQVTIPGAREVTLLQNNAYVTGAVGLAAAAFLGGAAWWE